MTKNEDLEDIANSYNSKYGKTNKELVEELIADPSKADEFLEDAEFNRYIINKKAEMHKKFNIEKPKDNVNNIVLKKEIRPSPNLNVNLKDLKLRDILEQVDKDRKEGIPIEADNYIPEEIIEISERVLANTLNITTIRMLENLQLEDDPKIAIALLQIYLNKIG